MTSRMSPSHPVTHSHPDRVASPAVREEALESAARLFRALGDAHRLGILTSLEDGELCVSELATAAQVDISTVSQRLRVLRTEGLVARRREGKHVLYRLADKHVNELVSNALAHAEELVQPPAQTATKGKR